MLAHVVGRYGLDLMTVTWITQFPTALRRKSDALSLHPLTLTLILNQKPAI